jgi:hypothetical protein
MERAQKSLYDEDPKAALDQLATAMAHFTSVLAELDLDTGKAHALNQQLRSDARSMVHNASTKTAAFYDQNLQKLVKIVDKVTEGAKHIALAKRICDDLVNHVESEVQDGNTIHGAKQATDAVKKALDQVQASAKKLEDEYDDLNKWFLRQKLK